MGIYSDGKIYGVSLVSSDLVVYSKKYPYVMGRLEINELTDLYEVFIKNNGLDQVIYNI